jgi:hypothetical protein
MRKKIILNVLKSITLMLILIPVYYFNACSDVGVPEPKDLRCGNDNHTTTEARWNIEQDYMPGYDIAGFTTVSDQVYISRTILTRNPSTQINDAIPYSGNGTTLPPTGGQPEDIADANRIFINDNYTAPGTTNGYLGCINHYSYLDPLDESIVGRSGIWIDPNNTLRTRKYSMLEIGRLRTRPNVNNNQNYDTWLTMHELGHQMNCLHGGDGNRIEGSSYECCAMNGYSADNVNYPWPPTGCTATDLYYCDQHLCIMNDYVRNHNGFDNQDNEKIIAAAINKDNGQNSKMNSNIKVKLSLRKETYRFGEIVYLKIDFENTAAKADSLININRHEIKNYIEVMDLETGNILPLGDVETNTYLKDPELVIEPGKSVSYETDLSYLYGNKKISNNPYGQKTIFDKGRYEVTFDYDNANLNSNITSFKVDELEKSRISEYNDLVKAYTSYKKENYTEFKINQYEKFLSKYPNSIYADQVFRNLAFLKFMENKKLDESFQQKILDNIQKFPESFYIGEYIVYSLQINYIIQANEGKKQSIRNKLSDLLKNTKSLDVLNIALQNEILIKNSIK